MTTPPHRRPWLAPEVVQTSSMDCGPAALKCLAAGFGLELDYGRLREACRTDVDGTSIDTLEEIARSLGLDAEQVLLPLDHVLLPGAPVLPALVVTRQPGGAPHFVVAWNRIGPWVQVMDPAVGRRWYDARTLQRELYAHPEQVSAVAWRRWVGQDEYALALRQRLRALGLALAEADARMVRALRDPTWRTVAALDAATRMTCALADARALSRGAAARELLDALFAASCAGAEAGAGPRVPPTYWPAVEVEGAPDRLLVRGAVVLRVRAAAKARAGELGADAGPELAAARRAAPPSPLAAITRRLVAPGAAKLGVLALAVALAAAASVVEAILLRGLLRSGEGAAHAARSTAVAIAFFAFLLLSEFPLRLGLASAGRQLELGLRRALDHKLPRLASRYLRSRPVSDLGERAHSLQLLRTLPSLGAQLLRVALHLAFTAAGLVWLHPAGAAWAAALVVLGVGLPLAGQRLLGERELRVRTHVGGLSRFYLDALLGLVPARTHGAERALRSEHAVQLARWRRAGVQWLHATLGLQAAQAVAGLALVFGMLWSYRQAHGEPSGALLLLYWALSLPALGEEMARLLAQLPLQRNVAGRLLEPLDALEEDAFLGTPAPGAPAPPRAAGGAALAFENVGVRLGSRDVLSGVNLSIAPGEHVGIVGASGAGKSSLVGCLLGWNRAAEGRIRVDGDVLDAGVVRRLRRQSAWVDESVQLWNRSLRDNVRFGREEASEAELATAVEAAGLADVLAHRGGLATLAGEGGGLFSGGEGQRLRLARALLREGVRLALLDEPFRGLARAQREVLLANARERWREATLLYVTHDVAETLDFDRVLVLEGGRVIEDGAPRALAAMAGTRYRALLAREREVQGSLWGAPTWRRWRLDAGRLEVRS